MTIAAVCAGIGRMSNLGDTSQPCAALGSSHFRAQPLWHTSSAWAWPVISWIRVSYGIPGHWTPGRGSEYITYLCMAWIISWSNTFVPNHIQANFFDRFATHDHCVKDVWNLILLRGTLNPALIVSSPKRIQFTYLKRNLKGLRISQWAGQFANLRSSRHHRSVNQSRAPCRK